MDHAHKKNNPSSIFFVHQNINLHLKLKYKSAFFFHYLTPHILIDLRQFYVRVEQYFIFIKIGKKRKVIEIISLLFFG